MAAPFLDAKSVNYSAPGSVAAHYGWNVNNIDRAIQSRISGGTENAADVRNLINTFLGKRNVNLNTANPQQRINALDYAYRELSRQQQTKKGFFDTAFGKILGVGATALGSVVGGPIGGALVGGTLGGISGGPVGGILGALGGYGGAGLLGRVGVPTNLLNVSNPFAGGFANIAGGLGGTVGNVNAFMPGWVQAGAAGGAAGGAGSMGLLSSIGNFLSNPAVGNIIGGGLSYLGQRNAANQMNQAAQRAFENSQFRPYNISGPLGGASFAGQSATGRLSPEMQAEANRLRGLTRQNLSAYNRFNPSRFAEQYYQDLSNYAAPETEAATQAALGGIFNRGAWGSTTGAQDIISLDRARANQDRMFRQQAFQAGGAESDRLFSNYMRSLQGYTSTLGIPYEMISQGLSGGTNASMVNANAARYPWMAAQNSADASAMFWSNIGMQIPNIMQGIAGRNQQGALVQRQPWQPHTSTAQLVW